MEISAICTPGYERPEMQSIEVTGRDDLGRVQCTLEALRFAEFCFCPDDMDATIEAFDEHSGFAYGLASDLQRRRRSISTQFCDEVPFAAGFVGILRIRTEPSAQGGRKGLELLRYLKMLHAGMAWYAGLQAAPYDMIPGSKAYLNMRRRLSSYYLSDGELGFREVAAKSSPGLMLACWD